MKKNKSKKLKKQFKQLLHEHINKAREGGSVILEKSSEEKIEKVVFKEKADAKNTSDKFARNDITKTVIIASLLIISMVAIGYYFNKYNLFSEVIKFFSSLSK